MAVGRTSGSQFVFFGTFNICKLSGRLRIPPQSTLLQTLPAEAFAPSPSLAGINIMHISTFYLILKNLAITDSHIPIHSLSVNILSVLRRASKYFHSSYECQAFFVSSIFMKFSHLKLFSTAV